jgi:hypothetical protein
LNPLTIAITAAQSHTHALLLLPMSSEPSVCDTPCDRTLSYAHVVWRAVADPSIHCRFARLKKDLCFVPAPIQAGPSSDATMHAHHELFHLPALEMIPAFSIVMRIGIHLFLAHMYFPEHKPGCVGRARSSMESSTLTMDIFVTSKKRVVSSKRCHHQEIDPETSCSFPKGIHPITNGQRPRIMLQNHRQE